MHNFWSTHKQLLRGSFYPQINEYPTFTHFKSRFKQAGYNFILPNVQISQFDKDAANAVILGQNLADVAMSYYLSDDLDDEYHKYLTNQKWQKRFRDTYVGMSLEREMEVNPALDFEFVTASNFAKFSQTVSETFPDYDNNAEYCAFCLEQSNLHPTDFINVLMKVAGRYVAFGSILMSERLDAGFLHNMGTIEEARRQGYFLELTKHLANIALSRNIHFVYANVDDAGASHQGFLKLGFKDLEKFWIYSK